MKGVKKEEKEISVWQGKINREDREEKELRRRLCLSHNVNHIQFFTIYTNLEHENFLFFLFYSHLSSLLLHFDIKKRVETQKKKEEINDTNNVKKC